MPRVWKDRAVERPRTFNIQNNADGTITLIPAPGQVIEEGTPVNASNLNAIEKDILDAAQITDSVTNEKWKWGMEDGIAFIEKVVE